MNDEAAWNKLNTPGYKIYQTDKRWWKASRYTITRGSVVVGCASTIRESLRKIERDKVRLSRGQFWEQPIVHEESE